jgi:hypothetical protein
MKKHVISAALLALMLSFQAHAQTVGNNTTAGLDIQTNSGGFVTQLPPAPPEIKGSYYLTEDWKRGSIYLKEMSLKDYYFKYDIQHNQFEIKIENQVKVLSGQRVEKFEQDDNTNAGLNIYVNSRGYTLDGTPVQGFLQVIIDGNWDLVSKTEVKLVKSGYVAALDAGSPDAQLSKSDKYYLADKQGHLILAQSIKKKSIPEIFQQEPKEAQDRLIAANLNSKRLPDLINMVGILNGETQNQ